METKEMIDFYYIKLALTKVGINKLCQRFKKIIN